MGAKISIWVWAVVLVASLLISGHFVVKIVNDGEKPAKEASTDYLLPVNFNEVSTVEVIVNGRIHRFVRNEDDAWFKHVHEPGQAKGAHHHELTSNRSRRIAKTLTTFSRTRVERTIAKLPLANNMYGTNVPEMVVKIFLIQEVQPTLSLHIGHQTPDGFARYVAVAERGAVVVLPEFQVKLIRNLVASFIAQ